MNRCQQQLQNHPLELRSRVVVRNWNMLTGIQPCQEPGDSETHLLIDTVPSCETVELADRFYQPHSASHRLRAMFAIEAVRRLCVAKGGPNSRDIEKRCDASSQSSDGLRHPMGGDGKKLLLLRCVVTDRYAVKDKLAASG